MKIEIYFKPCVLITMLFLFTTHFNLPGSHTFNPVCYQHNKFHSTGQNKDSRAAKVSLEVMVEIRICGKSVFFFMSINEGWGYWTSPWQTGKCKVKP